MQNISRDVARDGEYEQSVAGSNVRREERQLDGVGTYRVYTTEDGEWYPSVSAINDHRPNPEMRHALRNWRQKYNGIGNREHHSDIRKVTSRFGTLAHPHALSPFTERDLWTEEEATAKRELQEHGHFRGVDAWTWARRRFAFIQQGLVRALSDEEIVDVLGVERYVLNRDLGYGGQYDLLYTRSTEEGEETVLCDLKTGSEIRHNDRLQVAAYAEAIDHEVDVLKIVRAYCRGSNETLEVQTDDEFEKSRDAYLEEFAGYADQLNDRVRSGNRERASDTDSSKGSATDSGSATTLDNSTSPATEDDEDAKEEEDPIAEAVDLYAGSPGGMGRSFRESVNDGNIPQLIAREVDVSAENREQVLERLDELLPDDNSNSYEDVNREDSEDDDRPVDHIQSVPEAEERSDTREESSVDGGEIERVDLPPLLATLVDLAVSSDDSVPDSRPALIEEALEEFLSSTVGAELDSSWFETGDEARLTVDCDPVLNRVLELYVATDDQFDDVDDMVTDVVTQQVGTSETNTTIEIRNSNRYRLVVDALVANDDYPCESADGVVRAALRSHLGLQANTARQ